MNVVLTTAVSSSDASEFYTDLRGRMLTTLASAMV